LLGNNSVYNCHHKAITATMTLLTLAEQSYSVFWQSVTRSHNWEDLLDRSKRTFLHGMEIQFGVSILWKVVDVEELAENCCGSGMGMVQESRGR
jgi:hypothetical protein